LVGRRPFSCVQLLRDGVIAVLCVPGYGELVFSFDVRCAECTHCSLPAAVVGSSQFDVVEFPYSAGCGTWSVPFDVFRYPVREFASSYICVLCITMFVFTLRQRGVYLRL